MRIRSACQFPVTALLEQVSIQPRRGVILLVVLGLLTLLELVGISFVMYSDTARVGVTQFREPTLMLRNETGVFAPIVGHDLQRSLNEEVDFRSDVESIDHLTARARCLRFDVLLALELERDPEARRNLSAFLNRIERYEDALADLRGILLEIQFGDDRR